MSYFLPVNKTTEEYGETTWVPHSHTKALRELSEGWEYIEVPGHFWRAQKDTESGEMVPLEPVPPRLETLKMRARKKIAAKIREKSEESSLDKDLADEAIRLAEEINSGNDPAAEDYPLIKTEAQERGLNRQEAINAVIQWVDDRKSRLADIHRRRIRAEQGVENATTEEEINLALENL